MYFWISVVVVLIACIFLEKILPIKYKNFLPLIMMLFLTFLSAFRYEIGWDYSSYQDYFETIEEDSYFVETSFRLIVITLRTLGFDYQMIFFIYSILTSIFIWKGFNIYFNSSRQKVIAIILYSIICWFISMDQIRQFLAVAVFLWGSKYILKKELLKCIGVYITCIMIHYSAIILLPVYFFGNVRFTKSHHIILVAFSFLLSKLISITDLFMYFLESFNNLIGLTLFNSYLRVLVEVKDREGSGLGIIFILFIWLLSIIYIDTKKTQCNYAINMFSIAMIIKILFIDMPPIYRLRQYFEIFSIICIIYFLLQINKRVIYVFFLSFFIFGYSTLFLNSLWAASDSTWARFDVRKSSGNINYEFNFKLIK